MINFGDIGDAPQAVRYALAYMTGISMFGVSLLSWLTLSLGLSWSSYIIAKLLNSFGIFNTPANVVANGMGFTSDAERWDFANLSNDLDNSSPAPDDTDHGYVSDISSW